MNKLQKRGDVTGLTAILLDRSRRGSDRRYAAVALGRLGDSRAVDPLISVLNDLEVRGLAAEALGAIGDLRAVGPIVDLLWQSGNPIVVSSAKKAYVMFYERHDLRAKYAADQYAEHGTKEFVRRKHLSLESWSDCPICGQQLPERVDHAARCARCDRYFTDPNFVPQVSTSRSRYGALEGASMGLFPPEMVQEYGYLVLGGVGVFTSNMAWRLVREDYGATQGQTTILDGALMAAASPLAESSRFVEAGTSSENTIDAVHESTPGVEATASRIVNASRGHDSRPHTLKLDIEAVRYGRCMVCDYIYDPEEGDPDNGIEPGTSFEDLPDDWVCPDCGVDKDSFEPYDG